MKIYKFKTIVMASSACFCIIAGSVLISKVYTASSNNIKEAIIPNSNLENVFIYPEDDILTESTVSNLQFKLSEFDSEEYSKLKDDLDTAVSNIANDIQAQYEITLAQEEANRKKEEYRKQVEKMQEQLINEQERRAKAAEKEELDQYNKRQNLFIGGSERFTGYAGTNAELDGVTGARDGPITITKGRNPYAIEPEQGKIYKQVS